MPLVLVLLVGVLMLPPPRADAAPVLEDFPAYQPATRCSPHPRPGTLVLARFLVRRYGSAVVSLGRRCDPARSEHGELVTPVTSEHQEGRAIDWAADARTRAGRRSAQRLLDDLFDTDARGEPAATARRMGVMYVIWDDRIYSAWRGYAPEPYLSGSCHRRRTCSATLRHRDHVHLSLTRAGARGDTSWFRGRL
ncbi:hypothetical protein [Nocardioides sp.]|uniref:hypothetical protein n=1 Tax=Nocardioides sp. TaxID=35761 RepID=UPI0035171F23